MEEDRNRRQEERKKRDEARQKKEEKQKKEEEKRKMLEDLHSFEDELQIRRYILLQTLASLKFTKNEKKQKSADLYQPFVEISKTDAIKQIT